MLTEPMRQVIDALTTEQEDRVLTGKLVGRHESKEERFSSSCPECLLEVATGKRAMLTTLVVDLNVDLLIARQAYNDFEVMAKSYGTSNVANAIRNRILENRTKRQLQAEVTCSTQ